MIRTLTEKDLSDVKSVVFNSFSSEESSIIYPVIEELICDKSRSTSYCIGFEKNKKIVGAVAFSTVYFKSQANISAYILSPLAVHQSQQKKGIASELIQYAKSYFKANGVDAILVYGDPKFYSRFGFSVPLGKSFIPPYKLQYEFGWQALMMSDESVQDRKLNFSCVNALSNEAIW